MFEYIALIKDHIVRKKYVISFMTVSPVLPAAGSVPLCRVPGYAPNPTGEKGEIVTCSGLLKKCKSLLLIII